MRTPSLILAVALLGTANGSDTHEHFTLVATQSVIVDVPFGTVILHAQPDRSTLEASLDYPHGVHVDGGVRGNTIDLRVSSGNADARWGTLTIDYPVGTHVSVRNDAGDIALDLPAQYAPAIAVHSAHLHLNGRARLVSDPQTAAIFADSPAGTVTVTTPR